MTSTGPESKFSFNYELQPDDLAEFGRATPKRKGVQTRRRTRIYTAVVYGVIAVVLTVTAVAIDHRASGGQSGSAPTWMYAFAGGAWGGLAYSIYRVWWLSPERIARRVWDKYAKLHGWHHDEVGSAGVRGTAPDGSQSFFPWSAIDRVIETEIAFNLADHGGTVIASLPKRGLPSPDLIPSLRQFLQRSVDGSPAADGPPTGAARPVVG